MYFCCQRHWSLFATRIFPCIAGFILQERHHADGSLSLCHWIQFWLWQTQGGDSNLVLVFMREECLIFSVALKDAIFQILNSPALRPFSMICFERQDLPIQSTVLVFWQHPRSSPGYLLLLQHVSSSLQQRFLLHHYLIYWLVVSDSYPASVFTISLSCCFAKALGELPSGRNWLWSVDSSY